MTTRSIRIFYVLALASILGIIITQTVWLKKAYTKNEKDWNKQINLALNEVVRGILTYNNTSGFPLDPVKQIEDNYYVVMVNDQINADVLEYYLVKEFKKLNIDQRFEFGIYDCSTQKMKMGRYVEGTKEYVLTEGNSHPAYHGDNYYFTVYFPHKTSAIISQMELWIYSSAVISIVVIFFAYSLFVILKQKRLSEIQRDFINNMTHEIRTPLATIGLSAETLREPTIIHEPLRLLNYATIISDETMKLKQQVERVLSIADSGNKLKLHRTNFDLHELIQEVTNRHLQHQTDKPFEISYDLNATEKIIHADRMHIGNLISNLIDNAMKYSKSHIHIHIQTRNIPKHIEFIISDEGIGIPKQHLKHIFDQFYRVPNGNVHDVKGFGIGLNYVQLITRLHKGTVLVTSEPQVGTTFKFTLPL